jgi:hypothetical protein
MSIFDRYPNMCTSYYQEVYAPNGTVWRCFVSHNRHSFTFTMFVRGTQVIPRMHQHTFIVAGNDIRSAEVRVQVLENVIGYYKTQSINEEDKLHLYQCIVEEVFKQLEYE